jgi:cytochrome P450
MTAALIHNHPELFPNPEKFHPERWLYEQSSRHHEMDKYILSFFPGSRQCIGIK